MFTLPYYVHICILTVVEDVVEVDVAEEEVEGVAEEVRGGTQETSMLCYPIE